MARIRFSTTLKLIRGAKAFINLECGLTRGAVPNPRQQVEDQARNLHTYKRRIAKQRQALRDKDREISRLKRLSKVGPQEEAGGREGGGRPEDDTGTMPDFLIIGAQKGGTSTLYQVLTDHPRVEPAVKKEVHYFDSPKFARGAEWYRSNFPLPKHHGGPRAIIGEASPYYLYHPLAPRRAAQLLPQAKLIALLRNPVDRAYSDYRHKLNDGIETLSFEEAIEAEEGRIRGEKEKMLADEGYSSRSLRSYAYLNRGIYVDQLAEWHRYFDREQLLVLKSEDFFEHTARNVNIVLDFLGLPPWDKRDFGGGRNRRSYEPMSPGTREWLDSYFEPHNQRLYEYLGTDFCW